MDYVKIFYYNLYQLLISQVPVDTHNMQEHIVMTEHPDYLEISISAPKNDDEGNLIYDYTEAVNEALAARYGYKRKNGKVVKPRPMSAKESRNYHWVQRCVKQAALQTTEKVIFEGGFTI